MIDDELISDPLRPLADILKPDERQTDLSQSLADVHAKLSGLVLHKGVSVGVRQLFESAKNVRLYTYFVYRFHQVAEMVAYQALEMSLLLRWKQENSIKAAKEQQRMPTMGPLLKEARAAGWFRRDGFSGRYWRAETALLDNAAKEAMRAMVEGKDVPGYAKPTAEEIETQAASIDVGELLAEIIPQLRNDLAHGSAKLAPISDYVLQDVCDAVNMMWRESQP